MNNYEQFCQIAKDFGLDVKCYICSLPELFPLDYIMKYDEMKHKIYCADHLGFGFGYICCFGYEELIPKLAIKRVAELVEQYKQLKLQKKQDKMKEDF